ncbi:MAG: hypothetical protein OHK0017_00950 [Patescibacteria group bacterium]
MTLWQKLQLKQQHIIALRDTLGIIPKEKVEEVVHQFNPFDAEKTSFYLAFVQTLQEVDMVTLEIGKLTITDPVVWLCYPKGSSRKFKCEFNRDNGWEALGKLGFEPVRQVAIDQDWSALRFRRVQNIQKFTRGFAITNEGKKRIKED